MKRTLQYLTSICNEIAAGNYKRVPALFELTSMVALEPDIAELSEAFGMMLVKVEAREFKLNDTIEELRQAKQALELSNSRLGQENLLLRKVAREQFSAGKILGVSPQMRDLVHTISKVADTPVTVLINGETGTGKELVAKALHFDSRRADKPFIALNCSAIPESIFEAEIFGIEKGVATGVDKREGRIEQANGGTLFLDEIGDMPLSVQAKMLRALEERVVERVGGRKPIPVDIRVVAATHRDLKILVSEGKFREDLYYRINVINLRIPPLRERTDDIAVLAEHCLERSSKRIGRTRPSITSESLALLCSYNWPGNVRELENEIERAVALSISTRIRPEDFSPALLGKTSPSSAPSDSCTSMTQNEAEHIRKALESTGNNKSMAARTLGISREGLRKKMIRLGMLQET